MGIGSGAFRLRDVKQVIPTDRERDGAGPEGPVVVDQLEIIAKWLLVLVHEREHQVVEGR
jgi:hypothetical protein